MLLPQIHKPEKNGSKQKYGSFFLNFVIIVPRGNFMNAIETVKQILSEKVDITNLKEEDSLQSLGLDSLDLVEVMLAIEDELGIEFTSEEIAQLTTLKDVVKLIERKTK